MSPVTLTLEMRRPHSCKALLVITVDRGPRHTGLPHQHPRSPGPRQQFPVQPPAAGLSQVAWVQSQFLETLGLNKDFKLHSGSGERDERTQAASSRCQLLG